MLAYLYLGAVHGPITQIVYICIVLGLSRVQLHEVYVHGMYLGCTWVVT